MSSTVIIVTYNGMQWIERCLKSIPSSYSVVVVDNCSSDDTCNFIKHHFKETIILKQEKNLGFGQANNIGIAYALKNEATAVFLLNQDAYLYPNTIEQLEKASTQYQEYGILSPIHLDGSGKKMDRLFSYYMSYDNNKSFYSDAILEQLKGIYDVPFVNAAGWFIPVKTLETIGGFDPIFFHYGEDENYCQRLRYHGLRVGVLSTTFMIHDRADRVKEKIKLFSEKDYKEKEKKFKTHHGDLNHEHRFYNNYSTIFKALCSLKFKRAYCLYCFLERRRNWLKQCLTSKTINKKVGKHYLDQL